jgi:DNA-binding NtrC family response regulator
VGGTEPSPVDLRVCAATHRDLKELVAKGEVRADLYARLSGMMVSLPSLRDRREDLGLLIAALLQRLAPDRAARVTFTAEAARRLFHYHWPHNVRELEKALQTALVLADDGTLEVGHFPAVPALPAPPTPAPAPELDLAELDEEDRDRRERLAGLLAAHGGNITAVARAMNKDRKQVRRWLKRYRLVPASFEGE